MKIWLGAVSTAAAALCVGDISSDPAVAGSRLVPPVTISHFGTWTLSELGYPGDRVYAPPDRSFANNSLYFLVPRRLNQTRQMLTNGRGIYYVVHLHMRVVFDRNATKASFVFAAATNNSWCALMAFSYSRRTGRPRILWNSSSVIDGQRKTRAISSFAGDVRFSDYTQLSAIRAGRNSFSFGFVGDPDPVLKEIRIYDDTSIEVTHQTWSMLKVAARRSTRSIRVGQVFNVPWRVRNIGDRPSRAARVAVDSILLPPEIRTVGRRVRRVGTLRRHRSTRGAFRFRATSAGHYRITIDADSETTSDFKELSVAVAP